MALRIDIGLRTTGRSMAENLSYLEVTVTAYWSYGSYDHSEPAGAVTVDRQDYPFQASYNPGCTDTGSQVIFRQTVPVHHMADGNKKVLVKVRYGPDIREAKLLQLRRIPRASTLTVPDGEMGSPLRVQISAEDRDFTHILRYSLGSQSGLVAEGLGSGEYTWAVPLDLASALPDAEAGPCTYTLETYTGAELVGSTTAQARLRVPDHVGLTLADGWLRLEPVLHRLGRASLQGYVQGRTQVRGTVLRDRITGRLAYGATVQSVNFRLEGRDYQEPLLSQVLESAGSLPLMATVTDSRGRSQSRQFLLTVLPYAAPRLKDVQIFRCNALGEPDSGGYYASVEAGYAISALEGQNEARLTVCYRQLQGSYSAPQPITPGRRNVVGAGKLLPTQSYELRLELTDTMEGSTAATEIIPTDKVFFHGRPGGLGAAFGKYAEEDGLLDVDWNLRVRGKSLLDWAYPVGSVCLLALDGSPQALLGGTWKALSAPQLGTLHLWQRIT